MPKRESSDQTRTRLTRADWAAAALEAMGAGGLAAVAIEPIAASLGVSKGSAYWHFRDRAALVDAALALWEADDTEGVIVMLEHLPDPRDRMLALFAHTHPSEGMVGVESVVLAEASDPQVGPVLLRVTQRRIEFMTTTLQLMGRPYQSARHQALLAYQIWIGYVQLQAAVGELMPTGEDREAFLRHVQAVLQLGVERKTVS